MGTTSDGMKSRPVRYTNCPVSKGKDRPKKVSGRTKATAPVSDISVAHRWHLEEANLGTRRLAAALRGFLNEGLTNA